MSTGKQVYIVYGNDFYMKREFVSRLMLDSQVTQELNQTVLKEDFSLDDVITAAYTIPMGPGGRCLVVFGFIWEGLGKREQARFIKLFDSVPDQTTLIFVREEAKLPSGALKLLERAKNKPVQAFFEKPSGAKAASFVKQRFKEQGVEIDQACCRQIATLCDEDSQGIVNEVAKLCSYARAFSKPKISQEDINIMVHNKLEQNIFELGKEILSHELGRAFLVLKRLTQNNEQPIAIVGALRFVFSDLLYAKLAQNNRVLFEQFVQDFLGIYKSKTFRAKNAFATASNLTIGMIRNCIFALSNADLALKNDEPDPVGVLEELLCRLQIALKKKRSS